MFNHNLIKACRNHIKLLIIFIALFFISGSCVQAQVNIRIQDYLLNEPEFAQTTKSIIEELESRYPNIKVKLEKVSSNTKAIENLKSNNPPDIARVESYYISHLADRELILKLNDFVEEMGSLDYYWIPQFADHAIVPCLYGKRDIYGVPQEGSAILLYVNKELCKNAGLDIEKSPPKNWDKFLLYANKLTNTSNDQYGFGGDFIDIKWAPYNLQSWLLAGKARLFDEKGEESLLDSDRAEKAFSTLIDFYRKYNVMPSDVNDWNTEQLVQMFANGKLGMMQGDFSLSRRIYKVNPDMRTKTKVIPFLGEASYSGHASAFCISTKTEVPQEAFKSLHYLTIRSSLLKLFENCGRLPARRWLYKGTIVEKDKDGKVFGKASHYAVAQRIPPEWPEISANIVEILKKAFKGEVGTEDAIEMLHKKIEEIL